MDDPLKAMLEKLMLQSYGICPPEIKRPGVNGGKSGVSDSKNGVNDGKSGVNENTYFFIFSRNCAHIIVLEHTLGGFIVEISVGNSIFKE